MDLLLTSRTGVIRLRNGPGIHLCMVHLAIGLRGYFERGWTPPLRDQRVLAAAIGLRGQFERRWTPPLRDQRVLAADGTRGSGALPHLWLRCQPEFLGCC